MAVYRKRKRNGKSDDRNRLTLPDTSISGHCYSSTLCGSARCTQHKSPACRLALSRLWHHQPAWIVGGLATTDDDDGSCCNGRLQRLYWCVVWGARWCGKRPPDLGGGPHRHTLTVATGMIARLHVHPGSFHRTAAVSGSDTTTTVEGAHNGYWDANFFYFQILLCPMAPSMFPRSGQRWFHWSPISALHICIKTS